jgi:predicted O-methyltransferase YrrM
MDELEEKINAVCTQENLNNSLIYQNREEFLTLCRYVHSFKPHNFLEIGCLGPSFNVLASLCTGKKVALDMNENGRSRITDPKVHFILGFSNQSYSKVSQICSNFDFIFIDGDHTYKGVSDDFYQYKTLLTPRGFIAFHDMDPDHRFKDMDGGGVYRFWQELDIGHKTNIVCTRTDHDVTFKGGKTHFGGIGIWRP